MVEAVHISKKLQGRSVIKDVSLKVEGGRIYGLLGPNGAGKTTLLRILSGLLSPDAGSVVRKGRPGAIIERPALYGYLSAHENLRLFSCVGGADITSEQTNEMLKQVGLDPSRKDRIDRFSMGMRQRLGIAVALLSNPEILLLDEPFSGLDPAGGIQLQELIYQLSRTRGIGIVVSSHQMDYVTGLCDELWVLMEGSMVRKAPASEVLKQLTASYLILGENLKASRALARRKCTFRGDRVEVVVSPEELPSLLHDMDEEGVGIQGCIPQPRFETLDEESL